MYRNNLITVSIERNKITIIHVCDNYSILLLRFFLPFTVDFVSKRPEKESNSFFYWNSDN